MMTAIHRPCQPEIVTLAAQSHLTLWRQALPRAVHEGLYERLIAALAWGQSVVRVYGREHLTPRLTTWEGDEGVSYRYSGLTETASGWPPVLLPVLEHVQSITGRSFNSVLGNYYRDGGDSMGYHCDDETELGPQPWIASLSLGEVRDFVLRPRRGSRKQCAKIALPDNSLLLMSPQVQRDFEHALPRRAKVDKGRINLTFRQIIQPQNA